MLNWLKSHWVIPFSVMLIVGVFAHLLIPSLEEERRSLMTGRWYEPDSHTLITFFDGSPVSPYERCRVGYDVVIDPVYEAPWPARCGCADSRDVANSETLFSFDFTCKGSTEYRTIYFDIEVDSEEYFFRVESGVTDDVTERPGGPIESGSIFYRLDLDEMGNDQ